MQATQTGSGNVVGTRFHEEGVVWEWGSMRRV